MMMVIIDVLLFICIIYTVMSSRVAINNLNLYIDIHVNVFHVGAYTKNAPTRWVHYL